MESEAKTRQVFTLRYHSAHSKKPKVLKFEADESMTLDTMWISQKNWFGPGTRVTISDEHGNAKSYIKR